MDIKHGLPKKLRNTNVIVLRQMWVSFDSLSGYFMTFAGQNKLLTLFSEKSEHMSIFDLCGTPKVNDLSYVFL